jgi:hypothetical protein
VHGVFVAEDLGSEEGCRQKTEVVVKVAIGDTFAFCPPGGLSSLTGSDYQSHYHRERYAYLKLGQEDQTPPGFAEIIHRGTTLYYEGRRKDFFAMTSLGASLKNFVETNSRQGLPLKMVLAVAIQMV